MKITISSGKPDAPRDVTVEEEGKEPVRFKAPSLKDAHKMVKQGREHGWDSLTKKAK